MKPQKAMIKTETRALGEEPDPVMRELDLSSAHANLRWVYDYWNTRRQGRELPTRETVDPLDMPAFLPLLGLMDVAPSGTVRVRLAGTALRELFGREVAGEDFMALFPDLDNQAAEARALGKLIAERRPVYREGPLRWRAEASALMSQRLYLPLTQPQEERISLILWASTVFSEDGGLRSRFGPLP